MESITKAFQSFILEPTLKAGFTIIGSIGSYAFGFGNVELWIIIGILIILDIISGVLRASKEGKEIKSRRMFDKLAQSAVYVVVIGAGNMVARACDCLNSGCPEEVTSIIRISIAVWIISTEIKSILENLNALGVKIGIIEEIIQKYIGNKQSK